MSDFVSWRGHLNDNPLLKPVYDPLIKMLSDIESTVTSMFSYEAQEGAIYIIQSNPPIGPFKIGFSSNIERRLVTLQTSAPYPLKVIHIIRGGHNAENYIHRVFASFKLEGEWFDLSSFLGKSS